MSTMNVSMPDELRAFVEEQVSAGSYTSTSEYVRMLVRRERDREHLRHLLLEGASSGESVLADDAFFDALHREIDQPD